MIGDSHDLRNCRLAHRRIVSRLRDRRSRQERDAMTEWDFEDARECAGFHECGEVCFECGDDR